MVAHEREILFNCINLLSLFFIFLYFVPVFILVTTLVSFFLKSLFTSFTKKKKKLINAVNALQFKISKKLAVIFTALVWSALANFYTKAPETWLVLLKT